MSNVFGRKVVSSDNAARTQDRIGGQGVATGVYDAIVTLLYTKEAESADSQTVTAMVKLTLTADGRTFEDRLLICGKDGKNYYTKQDGTEHNFSGYDAAADIAAFTAGLALEDLEVAERTIEIRDFETKTNKYVTVEAYPQVEGVPIKVMLQREKHNKQQRIEVNGKVEYKNLADTYEKTVISRVLDADGFTFNERVEKAEKPEFMEVWVSLNEGKVYDRTDKKLEAAKEAAVAPKTRKLNI